MSEEPLLLRYTGRVFRTGDGKNGPWLVRRPSVPPCAAPATLPPWGYE
jgi:hypothetical protein